MERIAAAAARRPRVALWIVVAIGLAVRLYGIELPLVDSLHQRQTQTAMVARNLYRDGLTFWLTRYDIFGNVPGYAILEFPLVNTLTAALYVPFGVHEVFGRVVSVVFWIGSAFWMWALARRFLSEIESVVAVALYAASMTGIFMSRAFMPESAMMFFLLGTVVAALRWMDRPTLGRGALAASLGAMCFLVKSPSTLILVPLAAAWLGRHGWRGALRWEPYALVALALLPALVWNVYASRVNATYVPTWKPESFLLERGGGWGVRLSPLFYSLIGRSIVALLTPVGLLLAAGGLVAARRWRPPLLLAWLAAWAAFVFVFAEINMWHPYYQLPILPPAVILGARGLSWLHGRWLAVAPGARRRWRPAAAGGVLAALVVQAGAYLLFFKDSYDPAKRVPYHLEVSRVIREATPVDAVLIANDLNEGSSTTLMYYADRRGWSLPVEPGEQAVKDLEALRAQGGTVYAAVDSSYYRRVDEVKANAVLWDHLTRTYEPIRLTDRYVVFDLTRVRRAGA